METFTLQTRFLIYKL